MWKRLAHLNVVPFLGIIETPVRFVSACIPGVQLSDYIASHPEANRLELVGVPFLIPRIMLTPFQVSWHRKRPRLPPFL